MSDSIKSCSDMDGIQEPVAFECIYVARMHHMNEPHTIAYYQILRQLMLAGFCLTLLVGCTTSTACPSPELSAFQQSLRTADREILEQTTKVVSGISENTVALSEIKEKIDGIAAQLEAAQVSSQSPREEVILSDSGTAKSGDRTASDVSDAAADTSPDKNANDSQPATRSVAESGDVPLFVSVSRFCLPCNQLKKDFLNGKLKGFAVTFCVQSESHRDELIAEGISADQIIIEDINASPFPAIRYKSTESTTGWKWHKPRGYGPRVLMELRATLLGEKTPVEYPQTSTGGEPVGSIFQDFANSQIPYQRNAVRFVSRGTARGWRQNFVSRQTCTTGSCP